MVGKYFAYENINLILRSKMAAVANICFLCVMCNYLAQRHTGQSEVMVNVPNINTEFMVSAIVMHPEDGLAVVNTPIKVSSKSMC